MPKSTYQQLPQDKQLRVLEACFDEFSQSTFSDASINRIIKQANISRGSFYQYFESKEDCYLEVLSQIGHRKMEMFQRIKQLEPNLGVFDQAITLIKQIAQWMDMEPRLYRIGVLMDLDHSDFMQKLQAQNPGQAAYFKTLIEMEQAEGLIRQDIKPQLLSDLMVLVSQKFLQKHFNNHGFEAMIEEAEALFAILKRGTQGETHV